MTAAELVTSRGPITSEGGARVLGLARDLAADPRIDVLSITDNPGGHAMLSPDALGTDLISRGQEVIIHLACKDWNRNALESRGWQLSSAGFDNVLASASAIRVRGIPSTVSAYIWANRRCASNAKRASPFSFASATMPATSR